MGKEVVDTAVKMHRELDPGLLETVEEVVLAESAAAGSQGAAACCRGNPLPSGRSEMADAPIALLLALIQRQV